MIRAILAVAVPTVAAALIVAWVLGPSAPLPARFGPNDCRRIELVDSATGLPVAGAEDIVLAPDGRLILSSRDRESTARSEGALYSVDLRGLGAEPAASARPLLGPREGFGSFHPHGIGISPDGGRLAVVNHLSENVGVIEVGALGPRGWTPDHRIEDPRLCRANDVEFSDLDPDLLRVTIDRADCTMSVRDLVGGTGSVAPVRDGALETGRRGLEFPNGILGDWVAETRGFRLSGPDGSVAVPGGPDNLTPAEGRIVAALHASLVRLGLYINGWIPRAGSRIAAVDPATGAVEVLYDDPAGTLFSGATVGLLSGDRLVAGSVRDAGLLYCERAV